MALLAASCYLARPGTGMWGTAGIQQVSSLVVLLCRYYKELIEIPVGIILLGALGSLLLSRCVRPALRMHALPLPPTCCAAGQTSVPEQIWSPLHTVWRTQLVCTAPAALGHQEWLSACRLPPGRRRTGCCTLADCSCRPAVCAAGEIGGAQMSGCVVLSLRCAFWLVLPADYRTCCRTWLTRRRSGWRGRRGQQTARQHRPSSSSSRRSSSPRSSRQLPSHSNCGQVARKGWGAACQFFPRGARGGSMACSLCTVAAATRRQPARCRLCVGCAVANGRHMCSAQASHQILSFRQPRRSDRVPPTARKLSNRRIEWSEVYIATSHKRGR